MNALHKWVQTNFSEEEEEKVKKMKKEFIQTSGSSSNRKGAFPPSELSKSLTTSLYISIADILKMKSLSLCWKV